MRTKTQKNFHKEMKKYEKKRRKSGQAEPLSYLKENNEYIPPVSLFQSMLSSGMIWVSRFILVIGFLALSGVLNPLFSYLKKDNVLPIIYESSVEGTLTQEQKILFDYLGQSNQYLSKVNEIITRYNNGQLEEFEIYSVQKVLIDSLSFTENIPTSFLTEVNEAILSYHHLFMNWLDCLIQSELTLINQANVSLIDGYQQVLNQLVNVFDELGISYDYNETSGLTYYIGSPSR